MVSFGIREPERWAAQSGVFVTLLVAWGAPVLRALLHQRAPHRWPPARFGLADSIIPAGLQRALNSDVYLTTLISPFLALGFTVSFWELSQTRSGWLALAFTLAFAGLAWGLGRTPVRPRVAWMHGWTAALMLVLASALLLDGDWLYLAVVLEVAAWTALAQRRAEFRLERAALHVAWGWLALWLLARLAAGPGGAPLRHASAWVNLTAMGLAAILHRREPERLVYWPVSYAFLLGWMWGELGALPYGQVWVSVAWGATSLVLLGLSVRIYPRTLRIGGIGTLFLLAAKLLLVDLATVPVIWRALLFAGMGVLFLLVSYFYPSLILPRTEEKDRSPWERAARDDVQK